MTDFDVAVIGAGPAGILAATLLNRQGFNVCVLEKQHFPRFVIGESLLPHAIVLLVAAGLYAAVRGEPRFQTKTGAAFSRGGDYAAFEFADKNCAGSDTALHVYRDRFDYLLAREAERQGVALRFGETVTAFDNKGAKAALSVESDRGHTYTVTASFVLDASGYGRVLPRLLGWDIPSDLPARQVHFTHIEDNITDTVFDRSKTLVTVHPQKRDVWLWLTPFADGRSSIGAVGLSERLGSDASSREILQRTVREMPLPARLLAGAVWENDVPFIYLRSFYVGIKALCGRHFAVLGNAAEFLDPVFSSGITMTLHSARLAASLVAKELYDTPVDWEREFAAKLAVGTRTFRAMVSGWYDGRLQEVVFGHYRNEKVRRYLSSILAGYAWDESNPFVRNPEAGLQALYDHTAQR